MEEFITRAARDINKSKYAIALTGAGISTESGIPDFRGPSGIWTKNPEAERQAYRSYERFTLDPKGWWEERLTSPGFLGDLGKVKPNPGHYALAHLEDMGALKCVITQNVDALHEKAGTKNLLEYHGNAFKLRCISCLARFGPNEFDVKKLQEEGKLPPLCPHCGGVVKSDGVAFGEPIPADVADKSYREALKCDLMLICGTSAVVYPFADLPRVARGREGVVIIEVNAESTPLTMNGISNYIIKGKTGEILPQIVEEVKKLRQ
jgi:NAD-dependent deacetylase